MDKGQQFFRMYFFCLYLKEKIDQTIILSSRLIHIQYLNFKWLLNPNLSWWVWTNIFQILSTFEFLFKEKENKIYLLKRDLDVTKLQ